MFLKRSVDGQRNINAHKLLKELAKGYVGVIKESNGNEVHKPLGFTGLTAKELSETCKLDIYQVVYALRLCKKEEHINYTVKSENWNEIRVCCTLEGEQALKESYYTEQALLADAKYTNALRDKYFLLWTALFAIIGYVAGWLLPIKQQSQPEVSHKPKAVIQQPVQDSVLKKKKF